MASQLLHIAIDRFGRLVLPKEIRDHWGFKAGTEFEVEEQEDAILLKPVTAKARLVQKQGLPVLELGEPIERETIQKVIENVRRGGISR
jgi:AbrB family looped-hinge helix DNA binding protein